MRRPFSVQVFLVSKDITNAHSYLLLHRHALPQLGLPAFWQGISGALEASETFAEAALREVREETSIALPSVIDTGFTQSFPIKPEWREKYGEGPSEITERLFFAVLPAGVEPTLSHEHSEWHWCSAEEAIHRLTFGRNAECIRIIDEQLSRR
jgi:lipoyl(octanoyl) transferase/dATP pyrophosphohydrolase